MIGAFRLLELARPTPTGADAASDRDEALRMIRGKKLVLGSTRYRYPSRPDLLSGAIPVLDQSISDGILPEVVSLLRDPIEAYDLTSDRERAFVVVSAFTGQREPLVLTAEVVAPTNAPIDISWFRLPSSADELAVEFERIAGRLAGAPVRDPVDEILLIGGSNHEAKDPHWRTNLEAIAEARGFTPRVLENVAPRIADTEQTARQTFRGRAQYIFAPYCGGPANVERLHRNGYGRSFVIDEANVADQQLMLRIYLDELAVDLPDPPPAPPRFSPEPGVDYYFKKIASGRGGHGDVMILKGGPCGHNAWASANKADQARMGIATFAGQAPVALYKCRSCTGGGFWCARF